MADGGGGGREGGCFDSRVELVFIVNYVKRTVKYAT
jgi:hypothetical protein